MPTETALSKPTSPHLVDIEDCCELVRKLSCAWMTAKEKIATAQKAHKVQYDRKAREPELHVVGDRVMVCMPVRSKEKHVSCQTVPWSLQRGHYDRV